VPHAPAVDVSMRLEHPVHLPADLPAQRSSLRFFAGRARRPQRVIWDRVFGNLGSAPTAGSSARDVFRRRDTEHGKLGSAPMSRVGANHRRPSMLAARTEAGGRRVAPLRRDSTATPHQQRQATAATLRAARPSHRRGQNGIPPTASEFEEITADTLPGSHFVRTWPCNAGSTREVGTVRGTRAREVGIQRGTLGSSGSPNCRERVMSDLGVGSNAAGWDHPARPRDPARLSLGRPGWVAEKLGSKRPDGPAKPTGPARLGGAARSSAFTPGPYSHRPPPGPTAGVNPWALNDPATVLPLLEERCPDAPPIARAGELFPALQACGASTPQGTPLEQAGQDLTESYRSGHENRASMHSVRSHSCLVVRLNTNRTSFWFSPWAMA
jgi:hypothetical protein